MESYLAIDLGVAKLLIGEIDRNGTVLAQKRYPATFLSQRDGVELIKRSIDDYIKTIGWKGSDFRPSAFGVGLTGRVNPREGMWLQIDPERTETIPVAAELTRHLGFQGYIDNDVKAATRAVRHYELSSEDFVYINVGATIAAGMVVGGQLLRGSHFNAGEVGHNSVGVNIDVMCSCGRRDCIEQIAAGVGFDKCARFLSHKYNSSLQIPPEEVKVDVQEIFRLAQAGDELCEVLVENAAGSLANMVMNMVRITDPDTVVLGGGIVADGFMHGRIVEKLNPTTMRFVRNGVMLTRLDPELIGLIGAGVVAMNIHENRK